MFHWLYTYPSGKYELVKVSWDDFPFPTEWKVIQNSMVPVTTNQSMNMILKKLPPIKIGNGQ